MVQLNKPNKTLYLKVEVISPVHVGMGKEKELVRGLDFIGYRDRIEIINLSKLFPFLKPVEIQNLTAKLANGNIQEIESMLIPLIAQNRQNHPIVLSEQLLTTSPDTKIVALMRNGFGKPYLPGSSIKGSLRSIFYHHFKGIDKRMEESEMFGRIDNNLMHFIQLADIPFDQSKVFKTKIFSADPTGGTWKDGFRGNHQNRFNDANFISYYESFVPEAVSYLKIVLTEDLMYDNRQVINFQDFSTWNLLDMLQKFSAKYLEKEIRFFTKYSNADLGDITSFYRNLLNLNNISPILRVGAGVGFHSITGDWEFPDHDRADPRNPLVLKAKTRKFAFERINNQWKFWPMGFVQLTEVLREEYEQNQMSWLPQQIKNASDYPPIEIESKQEVPEKPSEPEYYTGKISSAAGPVEATIAENGKPLKVCLFIKGYENQKIPMIGYNGTLDIGKRVKVTIEQVSNDKKILMVRFKSQKQ